MKENLKPCTYKQSEGGPLRGCLMACLLWNEPASYACVREVKGDDVRSRSESESEQGDRVRASRPETA
jgi:hypothetical protein